MKEVEFEGTIYEFPDDATEEEIIEILDSPKEPELERLIPGVYTDEDGSLFRVTDDGKVEEYGEA